MDQVFASYPGVGAILRWSLIRSRGVYPSTCLLETVPQQTVVASPGTLTLQCGSITHQFPNCRVRSIRPKESWAGAGPRHIVVLEDARWAWQSARISGRYNVRKADGTVDSTTRASAGELATLCLRAMGVSRIDVARMPQDVFPSIDWRDTKASLALDELCRYVACEVADGELGRATIWPLGAGNDPPGARYIDPPTHLRGNSRPAKITVVGGPTMFQSRLKLKPVVRQQTSGLPAVTESGVASEANESPFSYPGITDTNERSDAFLSLYKWFYTDSQADGTNTLPGCETPIVRGDQYVLHNQLLQSWPNPDSILIPAWPYVEGKFWPYGDDADSGSTIAPYTGEFAIDASRNLVTFPFPVWNLGSTGSITAPELYLTTSYSVRSTLGALDAFRRSRTITGGNGELVLSRPEIAVSVRHLQDSNGKVTGTVSTLADAIAEADAYLSAFAKSFEQADEADIEWVGFQNVDLNGRIAQIRMQGGVKERCVTRASRVAEFDVFGPSAQDVRRDAFVDHLMERPNATA